MSVKLKKQISQIVNEEVENFKKQYVEVVPGFKFNQYEVIKRINLYVNSKYKDRTDDAIFWNIVNPRRIHFAKNIDLDTKDFVPIGKGDTNFYQAWIVKMEFEKWKKENRLALTLNDLSEGVSTYGSIVWKKTFDKKGEVKMEEADLRNLYFDQTTKDIREANVIELHYMSEMDIRAKEGVWDNVTELIENANERDAEGNDVKDKVDQYEISERYGEVEDENGKIRYMHFIGAGTGDLETIAFEEELDMEDMPYYDFHIGRYMGTWLRIGVVQRLFDLQVRTNTLINQNAKNSAIAALLLFKSQEAGVAGQNVLEDAESGQIVSTQDLEQIGITQQEYGSFVNEMRMIEYQADKLCFTPEIIQGEASPSNTTFRGIATVNNAAKSTFKYIKESIGEKLGFIITEEILPEVVKKWNKEHVIDIADNGADIRMFDEVVASVNELNLLRKANSEGRKVTEQEKAELQARLQKDISLKGRKITVPKNFFNFDYGISMNVTGESVDKAQQNDAAFNALQMYLSNPMIYNNPMFRQYLENNNIPFWKMNGGEIEQMMAAQQAMQGGQGGAPQGQPIAAQSEDKLMGEVDTSS